MTRGEAINRVEGYLTDYLPIESHEELEEIIKALKQEPALDKIRAEIENLEEGITSYHNDRPWSTGQKWRGKKKEKKDDNTGESNRAA